MKKKMLIFISMLFLLLGTACGDGSDVGTFIDTNQIAIDSSNDRLFVTQPRGELFLYTASTLQAIGTQPVINAERLIDINALMPVVTTKIDSLTSGSTTRLFIKGIFTDNSGNLVTNRIRVIDYDGTSFTEASFSPIILSDGDATTTDSDNSIGDLIVDQSNAYLLVTDTSAGLLYVINASNGTAVTAPLGLTGNPQGMAIANNRLYICNSSSTAAQQVITVANLSSFATSTIDLDIPCHLIAAASNSSGTILVVKHSTQQQVLIKSVDTSTFAASASINSATSGVAHGTLTAGSGISSSIKALITTINGGIIYAYLTEQDGTIRLLQFASDLSSFTLSDLTTSTADLTEGRVYESGGQGQIAYFVSNNGFLLSTDVGTSDVDVKN